MTETSTPIETSRPAAHSDRGAFARIAYVDALRGLAILLVVAGHAIQWTSQNPDASWVFRAIYSFHMALFFVVSGIVGARGIRRPLLGQLKSKSLQLVVPFFAWFAISSAIEWALGGPAMSQAARELFASPDRGLWFLWVLFLCTMIAAVLLRLPKPWGWIALFAAPVPLYLLGTNAGGIGFVTWYLPFFAVGLLVSPRFLERRDPLPWRSWLVDAAIVVVWLALVFGWRRQETMPLVRVWLEAGLPAASLAGVAYKYVTAAAGIAASMALVRRIPEGSMPFGWLLYFGTRSLEIYVSHQLLLIPFTGLGILWSPVAFAVALGGSLLLAEGLKRVPVLGALLYGGRARTAAKA